MKPHQRPQNIDSEFIVRRSRGADLDALIDFNCKIHHFVPNAHASIAAMTRDLLQSCCPGVTEDAFSLIVERSSGKIVSAMAFIPQTWNYDGIAFGVGRPELVGTDPAFRGQGLVRHQFELFHQWCAINNLNVQAITGIPFFYRQFGYEFAAPSGGGRMGFAPQQLPMLEPDTFESFVFRIATIADLTWIAANYQRGCERYLLSTQRSNDDWCYELEGKDILNIHKVEIWVIQLTDGDPVGFLLCHKATGTDANKLAFWYDLVPGFHWRQVTPAALRFLHQRGQYDAAHWGDSSLGVGLALGEDHPAYESAGEWLPNRLDSGAWYIRMADVSEFLRRIVPVLQERLAQTEFNDFSGDLRLSNYHSGTRVSIQQGEIVAVEAYRPQDWEDTDAAFVNQSWLQLLLGFRSLPDLQYAYPDCWCKPTKMTLLNALFPRAASNIWGLA